VTEGRRIAVIAGQDIYIVTVPTPVDSHNQPELLGRLRPGGRVLALGLIADIRGIWRHLGLPPRIRRWVL
jgi:hypothetical protein